MIQMNLQKRKRLTDLENELMVARGKEEGRDSWDGHVHNSCIQMDNQQGPFTQHMGLYAILCGSLDGRGVWGKMDTCMCMAESL